MVSRRSVRLRGRMMLVREVENARELIARIPPRAERSVWTLEYRWLEPEE